MKIVDLHVMNVIGAHFDGAMHATDNPKGDMAHLPLDYLVNRGVVVDILMIQRSVGP